jgi:alanine dehydrogenase
MIFGVPKQIKDNETRVGMTPSGVSQLTAAGNTVLVEKGAGEKGGFPDEDYVKAGAQLVDTTEEVFASAEMILNVKEILPEQFHMLRDGQIIGAGLHTNANPEEVDAFLEKNITGIAYEDVTDKDGGFPGLRPSSPIAGKGAVFMAAQYLNSVNGGPGIMLADLPGIERSHVTVIGAGHAGIGAAETLLFRPHYRHNF